MQEPKSTKDGDIASDPVESNIREHWDFVRPGLEEIRSALEPAWIPEDIYTACMEGRSHLFTTDEGFVVLNTYKEPYTGRGVLFIEVAWAKDRGNKNVFKHTSFFEDLARKLGCSYIETGSPVDRLETYFKSAAWNLETRIYRKLVSDELFQAK